MSDSGRPMNDCNKSDACDKVRGHQGACEMSPLDEVREVAAGIASRMRNQPCECGHERWRHGGGGRICTACANGPSVFKCIEFRKPHLLRCSGKTPHNELCCLVTQASDVEQCRWCLRVFCGRCIQQHACEVGNDCATEKPPNRPEPMRFRCVAKAPTDPPQECRWPLCPCDAHAEEVVRKLVEMGWERVARPDECYIPERDGRRCADHPDGPHELACETCLDASWKDREKDVQTRLAQAITLLKRWAYPEKNLPVAETKEWLESHADHR